MLEFVGFIVLVAIIFGINFVSAVEGFIKFIVIGIAICAVLSILFKLIEKKNGAIFVIIASIVAIILGITLINDNGDSRIYICERFLQTKAYSNCATSAVAQHNNMVNKGWAYAIIGGIVCLIGYSALYDLNKAENKP